MRTLSYVCGATGESIGFEGPLYGETLPALRGWQWEYTLGATSLTGLHRQAREAEITVKASNRSIIDRLRNLCDRDIASLTPGALETDDGWTARCYIPKAGVEKVGPCYVSLTLTVILMDGVWRQTHTLQFLRINSSGADGGLNYPHGFPHNYGAVTSNASMDNQSHGTSPCKWIIYGPAVNPAILVNGANTVQVDATIPDGGYLIIDGLASPRTVTLVMANGDKRNMYAQAHRDKAAGAYAFDPLPEGCVSLKWDQSFSFDLEYASEEGGMPWT